MGRLSLPSFDSGRLSIHFTCSKVNISMRVSIRIRGSKCVQLSAAICDYTFLVIYFLFFNFFFYDETLLPGCEKEVFFPRTCPFLLHFTTLTATATVVVVVAAAVCCHERYPWKKQIDR